MLERGVTHVFMEVSSHALALSRADAIDFEYGIFTNLTRDHLDFHADMDEYFRTKARLISLSKKCAINIDCEYGRHFWELCENKITYSKKSGDFTARNVKITPLGCEYTLEYSGGTLDIRLPALGDFSVDNSLAAASVALDMHISRDAVTRGLLRFFGAKGRMERAVSTEPYEVIVDYAHTPDALERLLKSARVLRKSGGRIILVFGCGGDRDRGKRRQMATVASRFADEVIITSDNSRNEDTNQIIADILQGIDKEKPYTQIASRARAIEFAVSIARAGDVVLLAGKGHEKYEIIGNEKLPFDEYAIIKDFISYFVASNERKNTDEDTSRKREYDSK